MMEDIDNAGAEQLSFQQSAFDALERDFREVLNELVGDKTLERFRVEYEKLHATLKRSHDNEKRLIKKCRQLNQEIVGNAAKIQTALRLSLQDQNSIALLKKEIDKAWRMVDSAQEKEKRARDNVQKLKNEISNLTRLVDQGAGLSIGQENTVSELLKRKEELKMEIENAQKLIVDETHKAQSMEVNKNDLERKVFEGEKEVQSLKDKNVKIRCVCVFLCMVCYTCAHVFTYTCSYINISCVSMSF
jgi:chromosome segregation ATPase